MEHNEHRQEKIESLLAQKVAEFLSMEAGNMSLITVTRVAFNDKTKQATVFITVLPDSQEKTALAFAKRKSSDMRKWIKERINMGSLPVFSFVIDIGEKKSPASGRPFSNERS
jgi:ribosome-binding factor A